MFRNGVSLACFMCASFLIVAPSVFGGDIALFISSDIPAYSKAIQGIRQTLPSKTTVHEFQMQGNMTKGREMATNIRALNPDAVIVVGLKAALLAKVEIMDSPVVFCLVTNPTQYDLPTKNMTGVLMDSTPLDQLKSMKSVLPSMKRIGLLYHEDHSGAFVAESQKQATKIPLEIQAVQIHSFSDVPPALRKLVPQVDALWLIRDPTVVNPESLEFIMNMAIDHNLPVFGFSSGLMRYGALATFSGNYTDRGRAAGRLTRHILRGRYTVASLPPPHGIEITQYALNLNAAKFLGLPISDQAIQFASELFGGPGAFAKMDPPLEDELPSDPFLIQ